MRFKKVLAVVLLIITLLSSVSFLNVISIKASGNYTLAQLQAKYPNGKYWNGGNPESYTSTPCNHHGKGICTNSGSCGCNSYRGLARQCMGFAYQLASLVYGGNPYSEWTANRNVSALDSVKPGDVIRYNNNGHSIFVTNVSGDVITYADCNGGGLDNCLIAWNRTKTKSEIKKTFSYVDQAPYAWENNSTSGTTNVNITSYPDKNTITNTNAILWGQVNKPSSYPVTKIGIRVRKDGSTYSNGWSKYEAPSWNYVGEPIMYPYYNLNDELGVTLTPATKYWLQFYAVVNGTEYWSVEYYFTTTGTHTHNYSIHEYEAIHPHKYYKKCSCGDSYYTGETKYLSSCSTCTSHTCDKGQYVYYWDAHPHYLCYKCSICGKIWHDTSSSKYLSDCSSCTAHTCDKGEYVYYWDAHPHHSCYRCSKCGEIWADKSSSNLEDSCTVCYPFQKPIVNINDENFGINETIEISWNKIEKVNRYKLIIAKKDSEENYSENVITEELTDTTYSINRDLTIGEYRINVYAYDDTSYNYNLGDWNYQISDPKYFTISALVNYYDWTYDFDNAMKLISDFMFSDENVTSADVLQAYNKGLIVSKDVTNETLLLSESYKNRAGYRFTEWKILAKPGDSILDVTQNTYILQAQYEPLLYSKGECLYGDINFDEKVDILDLVRIKKMAVGTFENHVSADLDADNNTNAIDISILRELLLGF